MRCRSEKSMIQFNTPFPLPFPTLDLGLRIARNNPSDPADLPFLRGPTGPLLLAFRSALADVVFQQFRPQGAAALRGDYLAGQDSCDDLGLFVILCSRAYLPDVEHQ